MRKGRNGFEKRERAENTWVGEIFGFEGLIRGVKEGE